MQEGEENEERLRRPCARPIGRGGKHVVTVHLHRGDMGKKKGKNWEVELFFVGGGVYWGERSRGSRGDLLRKRSRHPLCSEEGEEVGKTHESTYHMQTDKF